jgi:hypothetical protein
VTYGIEIGRWGGMFWMVYYADVFIEDHRFGIYNTFNAFTKRGALRKAKRYINRISSGTEPVQVYSYDNETQKLMRIS